MRGTSSAGFPAKVSAPDWGFLRTSVPRFGVVRHRLVVLAPGATTSDRRRVRLHEAAPAVSAGAGLLALIGGATSLDPLAGTAIGIAAFCVAMVSLRWWSAAARSRSRRLEVVIGLAPEPLPSREAYRRCLDTASELEAAAAALRCRAIDPVEFELCWGRAWGALPGTAEAVEGARS